MIKFMLHYYSSLQALFSQDIQQLPQVLYYKGEIDPFHH